MLLAVAIALFVTACSPTYAPPVSAIHGGGPRRSFDAVMVDLGDAEVFLPGAAVRIPVTRTFAAEVGGEVSESPWAMGHIGARLTTPIGPDGPGQRAAADLEFGAGLGRGGENADSDGARTPRDLVRGAYLGAGFGSHGRSFGGFVRARIQISDSDAVPATTWTSVLFGVQLGSAPVRLRLAAGVAGYDNRIDRESIPLVEFGLELGR